MTAASGPPASLRLRREAQPYAAYYCEENVYRLAQSAALEPYARAAVFVSNPSRTCAIWDQRLAPQPNLPVVWDYHVVLLVHAAGAPWIYDLDAVLDFPTPARAYLDRAFPPDVEVPEPYRPEFRVVPAPRLFAVFASDRSHMRAEDGAYRVEPPPWAPLRPAGAPPTNLDRFVDTRAAFEGRCFDLERFRAWLETTGAGAAP